MKKSTLNKVPQKCIYWREYGSTSALPVLCLPEHPGLPPSSDTISLINLEQFRVIVLEPELVGSCAKSVIATLKEELAMIEELRKHLCIDSWVIFGPSFSSLTAIRYAQVHSHRCGGLILAGIWLAREKDIDWWWCGSNNMYPDVMSAFTAGLHTEDLTKMREYAYENCWQGDHSCQYVTAKLLFEYWRSLLFASPLTFNPELMSITDEQLVQAAKKFTWLDTHRYFVDDFTVLDNIDPVRNIPTHLLHGRFDPLVPPQSAFDLWQFLPEAKFQIAPASGHSHLDLYFRPLVQQAFSDIERTYRQRRL